MLRFLIWVVVILVVLVAGAAAYVWPRDDVPRDPDAVVVLGGAGGERAALGLELRDEYGAQLVLSSSASIFGERQGADCDLDAICIEPEPGNTMGEARMMARLADEHGWNHVTVATSRFHTTRARVLFRQCLGDRVTVVGATKPDDEPTGLRVYVREAVGTVAAMTIRRAC